ncbi:Nucleoside phosphorylase [Devosia enhydra]|uniref:Nucleoside phosphorylase n=1 Tax=Devosia enhydra TaxID=665118 RepID=A0A1K2HVW5_9HYPH|nr:hypothetical protein [Devosia enhydra]SFZ83011.1 Nucleoside phosphorylase [Devosia enhydra]
MNSPFQPLFLHFLNRELMLIRQKSWKPTEIAKFIRLTAIMTAGRLNAPFGQAHEMLYKSPDLIRLVGTLVSNRRLTLTSAPNDPWSFFDQRRELYSENRSAYRNYFSPSYNRLMNDLYAQSRNLRTTNHIKEKLVTLATTGLSGNTFSTEDAAFVKTQRAFVTGALIDNPIGATFSIYLKQKISPQPDASYRLGNISTRAFSDHYQEVHATVSPTGLYFDEFIEDYDKYPLYDIDLNFILIARLGLDKIVTIADYDTFFNSFARHEHLFRFVEMKDMLFESILNKLRRIDNIFSPNQEHIKQELRQFSFAEIGRGFVSDPTIFAEKIRNAIDARSKSDRGYAESLEDDISKKVSRTRIALFTATKLEDEVLRAQLAQFGFIPAGRETGPEGYYNVYSIYDQVHVIHVRTGMGSGGLHGSQRVAHDFLAAVNVEMAIAVGICFGVDSSKQSFGDVLVAEQFTLYEPAKVQDGVMAFRGDRIPAEARLVSYGHASAADGLEHAVHVGAILTGEKLVDDALFKATILAANGKAVGGEMETGGLVTSCLAKQVRFGMAKGICDFADKKSDDAQELAATNAVKLVLNFIRETWVEKVN